MGLFVTDNTIDVCRDPNATTPQDTIVLRAELDLIQTGRLDDEVATERQATGALLSVAHWKHLLLRAYIVDWRGPSFVADGEPIPCTREHINKLNARDPFVDAVTERVWNLHYPPRPEPTKKAKKKTPSTNDSSATSAPGSTTAAEPGETTSSP